MPGIDGLNMTRGNAPYTPVKKPRKKWRLFLLFLMAMLALSFWGTTKLLSKTNQIFTNAQNPLVRFGKFFISDDKGLIGEDKGKVNILLLGMGGEGHDGPLLTDTIIVAQIDTKTNEAVLVSIPRDFVVTINGSFNKINSVYAYAEAAKTGAGGQAAIEAIEKITGFEIPYFAAIDFAGFIKAIDHVGGLDVIIDRTFTDATFPDEKYDYLPPVTFTKGPDHMNGQRALQFARSRHGDNNEGSDFARSERQKKIITAFSQKVVKLNLTDLRTITNLLSDFTEHFRTNLEPHEMKRFAELGKQIIANKVYSLSLEPGELICDGIIEDYTARAYVIQPCEGKTITDIHNFLNNAFLTAKLHNEKAIVEIQNSTGKASAIGRLGELTDILNVKITTFKSKTPYERTILYDNSRGKYPNTMDYLENNFDFTKADIPYPNSTADFVIIIGKDML